MPPGSREGYLQLGQLLQCRVRNPHHPNCRQFPLDPREPVEPADPVDPVEPEEAREFDDDDPVEPSDRSPTAPVVVLKLLTEGFSPDRT